MMNRRAFLVALCAPFLVRLRKLFSTVKPKPDISVLMAGIVDRGPWIYYDSIRVGASNPMTRIETVLSSERRPKKRLRKKYARLYGYSEAA